jgi:hypothetical protein
MNLLALDPGHTVGVAYLTLDETGINPRMVFEAQPGQVYDILERPMAHGMNSIDTVVSEEFRLYPWLAQVQGFSQMKTVEVIGVIKYICAKKTYVLFEQRADVKKEARHLGETHGFPMKERTLGSGKGKYRGPDFDYPGAQHKRDALAHGVWWAYRHPQSPLYEG